MDAEGALQARWTVWTDSGRPAAAVGQIRSRRTTEAAQGTKNRALSARDEQEDHVTLTDDVKKQIDAMTYAQLLSRWRFAPIGHPLFEGESGKYFGERMAELRRAGEDHVAASKSLGWG